MVLAHEYRYLASVRSPINFYIIVCVNLYTISLGMSSSEIYSIWIDFVWGKHPFHFAFLAFVSFFFFMASRIFWGYGFVSLPLVLHPWSASIKDYVLIFLGFYIIPKDTPCVNPPTEDSPISLFERFKIYSKFLKILKFNTTNIY